MGVQFCTIPAQNRVNLLMVVLCGGGCYFKVIFFANDSEKVIIFRKSDFKGFRVQTEIRRYKGGNRDYCSHFFCDF